MSRSILVPQSRKVVRCFCRTGFLCFLLLSSVHPAGAAGVPSADLTQAQRIAQAEPAGSVQPAAPTPLATSQPPAEGTPTPDAAVIKSVREALLRENFTYTPKNLINPFVAFITATEAAPPTVVAEDDELGPPAEPQRPLTPLQKMKISEIEKGLKAITWGDLGRRAIIEDAAGKGYIVGVGTPVGEKNGVITEIFNDHLVIQQEFWDKKSKRMVPQNVIVKLVKVQPK